MGKIKINNLAIIRMVINHQNLIIPIRLIITIIAA